MGRSRSATLVVVDRRGSVRGALGPIPVAEPWWPEAGPVVDAVAHSLQGAVVLRLLRAEPEQGQPMGGQVTYLVQCDADVEPGLLGEVLPNDRALLEPHPLRLPWAEPDGPAADLEWVRSVVDVTGPARQHRSWNLSSIWSLPIAGRSATKAGSRERAGSRVGAGSGAGDQVWLKVVPPFMEHEAAVLEVLADQPVPRLLARRGNRLLLAGLPGEDGFLADGGERARMVGALVSLQRVAAGRVDQLLASGVPDHRDQPLAALLANMIDRLAPGRDPLVRLAAEVPDRLAAAASCSPPPTLLHGDPHPGNCRRGVSPPIWFDWGDAMIANPFLDLLVIERMGVDVVAAWDRAWREATPGCDPARARSLLRPVAALREAWVYQRMLDRIEATEHVYHRRDVPRALDQAERLYLDNGA